MNRDPEWIRQIARELEAGLEALDTATTDRLRQARHRAVAEARPQRVRWRWPVAGLATAGVAILLLVLLRHPASPPLTLAELDGLAVVTSAGDFTLYRELDFYHWLARNQENEQL